MYAGGEPILHIFRGEAAARPAGVLDHLAFSASDLKGKVKRLKAKASSLYAAPAGRHAHLADLLNDPCGAKVELDFAPDEAPPGGLSYG